MLLTACHGLVRVCVCPVPQLRDWEHHPRNLRLVSGVLQPWALTGSAVQGAHTRIAIGIVTHLPPCHVTLHVRASSTSLATPAHDRSSYVVARGPRPRVASPAAAYFVSVYGAERRAARCTQPPALWLRPGAPGPKACPPTHGPLPPHAWSTAPLHTHGRRRYTPVRLVDCHAA